MPANVYITFDKGALEDGAGTGQTLEGLSTPAITMQFGSRMDLPRLNVKVEGEGGEAHPFTDSAATHENWIFTNLAPYWDESADEGNGALVYPTPTPADDVVIRYSSMHNWLVAPRTYAYGVNDASEILPQMCNVEMEASWETYTAVRVNFHALTPDPDGGANINTYSRNSANALLYSNVYDGRSFGYATYHERPIYDENYNLVGFSGYEIPTRNILVYQRILRSAY